MQSPQANTTIPVDAKWTLPMLLGSVFGGVLMGMANLVPGISGGTMLLAAGIYPQFIEAIADVTRFRLRPYALLLLAGVGLSAAVSILLLAGPLKHLVLHQRWIMYSLFIGLTLGGIPVVWRLAKTASPGFTAGAVVSFALMVVLAVLQAKNVVGSSGSNFATLFVAGLAGASAMILPGLSGGYLLLLMGQYVPILSGISDFKDALEQRSIDAMMQPLLSVVLPVGCGVLLGVAVVGNLLQWLLSKYRQPTLGILLGLILGSVVGLWPFQEPVQPQIGDMIRGQRVTAETIEGIDPEDWRTEYQRPTGKQLIISMALIACGFGITTAVTRFGSSQESSQDAI